MTNLTEAVALSQTLVSALYDALAQDARLQRDRAMWMRLQSPSLQLVAVLSHAEAAQGWAYKQRGVSFARSHLAEFLAMLETARRVGSIDDINTHSILYKAAQEVANAVETPE